MKDFLEFLENPKVAVLLAGAAGAIIHVLHEGRELSWGWRLATFFAGASVAHFLTPAVLNAFSLRTIDDGPGTGFILGLFGMSMVGAGIRVAKQIDWESVSALLPWGKK